jgi:hypothetical protein
VRYKAGYHLTTESNKFDIGKQGVAGDTGIIRIGTQVPTALQTNTYIAAIYTNTSVSGLYAVIDSTGQLGMPTVPRQESSRALMHRSFSEKCSGRLRKFMI